MIKKLTPLFLLMIFFLYWASITSTEAFAKTYTKALVNQDTTTLKQYIKPAAYIPFYAKRFKEAIVVKTKEINDTLSSFVFNSDRGVIHTPVIKKNGEMWVDFTAKYPKDKYSYTVSITTADDSNLNNVSLSYDITRWELSGTSTTDLDEERSSYNTSIGSVEKVENIVIKNNRTVDLKVRFTKSRWDGKEFVDRQEKELDLKGNKKLKLAELF